MSGHSKWSTIKRKKGKADAERGRLFTRLIKEITVSARSGGGDPDSNPRLRSAVQVAKENNMPSDNIDRAIKKGTGELPGVVYEEVTYEGYGPGGVAIFIEVMTDNKNRVVAEIRHIMTKYGGNLGENGSVAWMFEHKGTFNIPAKDLDEDQLMMIVLDAGAEDMIREDGEFVVTTDVPGFEPVRKALEEHNIEYHDAELGMIPKNTTRVAGSQAQSLLRLMEKLEENDDVQKIYANFDMDENEMEAYQG